MILLTLSQLQVLQLADYSPWLGRQIGIVESLIAKDELSGKDASSHSSPIFINPLILRLTWSSYRYS